MQLTEVSTIDWYDNILKAFCKTPDGIIYYCCILALNAVTDEKVYLCVDIKYLKGADQLKEIIGEGSFKENWNKLSTLINLKNKNETHIVKARNLLTDSIELIKYKDNFRISKSILWGEYPYVLDKAKKFDDWWKY